MPPCCPHALVEGGNIGVEANSDILNVEDQNVHSFEHLGSGSAGRAVETVPGGFSGDFLSRLGLSQQTVLGSKEGYQTDFRVTLEKIGQALHLGSHTSVIGDQPDPLSPDPGEKRLLQNLIRPQLNWGGGGEK